jgi:hypothetical protein
MSQDSRSGESAAGAVGAKPNDKAAAKWSPGSLVLGLYGLALVVRVAAGLVLGMNQPAGNDEPEYYEPAISLAQGEGYRMVPQQSPDGVAHLTAYRMPGPALVLALSFLGLGTKIELARWMSVIVGSLSAPLMYLFSRRFLPASVAALAGLACALYPTWIYFSLFIYAEPYFLPASLLALLLTLRAIEAGGSLPAALLAGLSWGVVTLVRPHGLPMAFLAALYCAWRLGWRPAGAFMLGAMVPLVPWVVRNYAVFGRPVLLATEGGETMLGANNPYVLNDPEEHGMWVPPMRVPEYRERLRPIRDEIQRDEEQKALAIHFLRDHAGDIPALVAYKLWRWLTPVTKSGGLIRLLVLCSYGVLLALLLAGAFLGVFRSSPALHLVLLWTILMVSVTAVYWGGLTRGRLSLELMWIPWGTWSAWLLFSRLKRRPGVQI